MTAVSSSKQSSSKPSYGKGNGGGYQGKRRSRHGRRRHGGGGARKRWQGHRPEYEYYPGEGYEFEFENFPLPKDELEGEQKPNIPQGLPNSPVASGSNTRAFAGHGQRLGSAPKVQQPRNDRQVLRSNKISPDAMRELMANLPPPNSANIAPEAYDIWVDLAEEAGMSRGDALDILFVPLYSSRISELSRTQRASTFPVNSEPDHDDEEDLPKPKAESIRSRNSNKNVKREVKQEVKIEVVQGIKREVIDLDP